MLAYMLVSLWLEQCQLNCRQAVTYVVPVVQCKLGSVVSVQCI